jgi:flavin-dependent dehydrogenase
MQISQKSAASPDVLIVGSGPAGTTLAACLAAHGRTVCVMDKNRHPRFHIGESLLPMNLPIFERLGIAGEVKKIGVVKAGADFTCGEQSDDYRTAYFTRTLGDTPHHSYEVSREQFDQLLFDNCVKAGVCVHQQLRVRHIELQASGRHRVFGIDQNGREHVWEPRFVVDASGRDALIASKQGWKNKDLKHASVAIFSHFKGVETRPGSDQGNISIYWFEHGWIWMIPLPDDVMSIGAVCRPDYIKQRDQEKEAFFLQTLALCPAALRRMQHAERVLPVRFAGNYSYRSRRMTGNGYALIGDAYAFIDPVFSSGVYLAMSSAEAAVPMINHWLDGNRLRYYQARFAFNRRIRRGLKHFSWFIYRFTTPAMRTLFCKPRNFLQIERAVTSVLAGDVFDNKGVGRRLWIFRVIYWLSSLAGKNPNGLQNRPSGLN